MTRDVKIRNSLGVVLPKEAVIHLRVQEGDIVTVSQGADGSLRLSPTSTEVAHQLDTARTVMKRFRSALRELAQ